MTIHTNLRRSASGEGGTATGGDGDWGAPGTHIADRTVSNEALKILAERGFLKQCSDLEGLEKRMEEGPVTLYVGTDPTGPSLHAGHMVPMFAVAHLARAGHRPTVLIGGGTARVGDPSGKTEMRQMSSYEDIDANGKRFEKQLSSFSSGPVSPVTWHL
jgi:tyrosyl-tRNA synthetase